MRVWTGPSLHDWQRDQSNEVDVEELSIGDIATYRVKHQASNALDNGIKLHEFECLERSGHWRFTFTQKSDDTTDVLDFAC